MGDPTTTPPPAPGDWISLERFELPCVVGLPEAERRAAQRLAIEIGLRLDLDAAGGGDLSRSVDYGAALEQVQFIAQQGRWRLLESMALAIARHLLAPPAERERRAQVEAVRVKLTKPDVFGGRAVPGVEVHRHRAWYRPELRAVAPGVRAEVLQETKDSGAYRIHLVASARWSVPAGMAWMPIAGRQGRARCVLGVSHDAPAFAARKGTSR